MKRIPLLLTTSIFLILTGCSTSQEVAYWTDSSYKSALDYDAEQKKELEDEISSVHEAIRDILDNAMNNLESGNNINTTPQEPEDSTIVLNNANKSQCITYLRNYLINNKSLYKDYYLDVDMYCDTSVVATGSGSPVINHDGGIYVNIVNIATVSTVTDTDFYNYMVGPFSKIFDENSFSNSNGITMDYKTFKILFNEALSYFETKESLGMQ